MKLQKWPARLILAGFAVFLFAIDSSIHAQTNTNSSSPVEIVNVNTRNYPTIEIAVSVLDSTNHPLLGLTRGDFTVFEDGQPVPIQSVKSVVDENIPYASVLLIDTSTSMAGQPLELAKQAAIAFVQKLRDIDEVALISFNSKVIEVQTPTQDKNAVISAIEKLQTSGETALYDAIAAGVKTAQEAKSARRVVILLTDGNEFGNLSKAGSTEGYKLAYRSGIPIFTIGLGFGIYEPYLTEVAAGTGGTYYRAPAPDQILPIYDKISGLLRSQYVIDFTTTLPANGSTHTVRVQVNGQNSAEAKARYPAPVPVIKLSGFDPTVPIDKPTTITAEVVADNTLTHIEYQIDGKVVLSQDLSHDAANVPPLTIDPGQLTPGQHTLSLSVTDDQNHVGQASQDFLVAALPPDFTIDGLKEGETLRADRTVSVSIGTSQTPIQKVVFAVDDQEIGSVVGVPYQIPIRVLALEPGKHVFSAQVANKEAVGKKSVTFSVATGPRQTATSFAILQATRFQQETLTAQPTNTPTSTATFTWTPTRTSTNTPKPTKTPVSSSTPTASFTASNTVTRTFTPSSTPTATRTQTPTSTFTLTAGFTPSATSTPSPSPAPLQPSSAQPGILSSPVALLLGGLLLLLLIVVVVLQIARGRRAR